MKLKAFYMKKYTKQMNLQPDLSKTKGRGLKSIKLKMKKEKLQQKRWKYKGS